MSKEIYISTTPHETRLAICENDALTEIYYERENEYTLAGSIYNGRVTRVLPGMQSSFVDIGLERDAFLYITDFMEEAGDAADFDGEGKATRPRQPRRDAEPSAEGTEAAPREASPRPEGERSDRDRNDRGGRNRGGRRDGRNESRNDRGDRAPRTPQDTAPPETQSFEAQPRAVSTDSEAAPRNPDSGEAGEGPDGSRRWRGRRGRRRGRGDSPQGEATETQQSTPDTDFAPEPTAEQSRNEPRSDSRNEGRGDRDRGGRDRGGRDRGRLDSVRERFAPRSARATSAEPVFDEPTNTVDLNASSAEPFILPGESLSKYRRNPDGTREAAVTTPTPPNVTFVTATPSNAFVPATGWDGGAVLPGETLSRHRGNSGQSEPRNDGRGNRDRNDRGGRDRNQGRNESRGNRNDAPRQETRPARQELHPSEAVQPAVSSHHEPEPFELDQPHAHEFSNHLITPSPEETVEALKEYEPTEDTTVSFRVDPVPPSEFRQSAPTPEPVPEPEAAVPEPIFHASEEDAYVEPTATPEFTSIQPTGEMLSAPAEPATHTPASEEAHADAPIEHEQAVQSVTLAQAETATDAAPQSFSPGDGELEEEMMDDEEGEIPTLHAASHEDDMEVETLEGAADLASMLHDLSIDQITRPVEPSDDEDDDFDIDEEDLEEDEFDNGEEEGDEASADDENSEFADEEHSADIEQSEEQDGEAAAERSARPVVEGERTAGDRRPRRDSNRRGGRDRNDSRSEGRGDRNSRDRRPSSDRPRSTGGRDGGGGRSRHSAQTTNLPAISDLLKPGQELLVQIAKEPIAKKGARITSHIALPGRFLVFMPTVSHVGVSRKIESDAERRRLKEILLSERGDATGGFIVRTAAANAGEDELRSDLRFLLNLWTDIKTRSESSKSPALIYHDLNLVERILRDQVTDNFSAIWVDTEDAYERVLRFLQRFQPSLIRRVKLYTKDTPLFEQFGITEEINKALRSKVWLKSGGSIVINQTEALVAIDINTGKFVGKTARLEDTIVKTNLDAIPEIVRQIRLRDLGGIIIIDFIDMDERKNRNKVMMALEDELKSDRAPSKVLQFNDFGLVAITRKRVKQSLERTLSTTCGVCQGTGMVKSPVTVCNDIYIEMRKMQKHLDRGDVMLRVNPEVVKQLKAPGAKWLQEMEEMVGRTILVKSDPSIHPEQFDLH